MREDKKDEAIYVALGVTVGVIFTYAFSWALQNWKMIYSFLFD